MERPDVRIRRIYEPPSDDDGRRVLVDRLWPRGVSKERAALDLWLRDVAPSNELRIWYHEDRGRFDDFAARYAHELEVPPGAEALEQLHYLTRSGPVTLLTAAREDGRTHADVLLELLAGPSDR